MQTFCYWYNHWCYLFELITVVSILKYKTICDFIIMHVWKVMENQYVWWHFGVWLSEKTSSNVLRGNYPDFKHFVASDQNFDRRRLRQYVMLMVLVCRMERDTSKLHYIITNSSHFSTPSSLLKKMKTS